MKLVDVDSLSADDLAQLAAARRQLELAARPKPRHVGAIADELAEMAGVGFPTVGFYQRHLEPRPLEPAPPIARSTVTLWTRDVVVDGAVPIPTIAEVVTRTAIDLGLGEEAAIEAVSEGIISGLRRWKGIRGA